MKGENPQSVEVSPTRVVLLLCVAAVIVVVNMIALSTAAKLISCPDDMAVLAGVGLGIFSFAGSLIAIFCLPFSWAVRSNKEVQDA